MRLWILILLLLTLCAGLAAAAEVARTRLADGFDFPVGPPNGEGYYKARGFRQNGHLGEDWNGLGGGNSDLGDLVYNIGHGVVILARDVRKGWGNVVIVRHVFYENGRKEAVDSLYGHLDRVLVREGQFIRRGARIGTIGNNRGMYPAHLHFEIRKNLRIGINRSSFRKTFANYFSPTKFIHARRKCPKGNHKTEVLVNTFKYPHRYPPPAPGRARIKEPRQRG